MDIRGYKKCENYLLLKTSNGRMKLQPVSHSMIRVVYTLEEQFSTKESLMIVPKERPIIPWKVDETQETVELSTDTIRISVQKQTAAFSYFNAKGELIAREPSRGGKSLMAVDVIKTVFDRNAEVKTGKSVDGMRAIVEEQARVVDRKAYHTKLEFEWEENEALYGLGSHEEGMLNLRGRHQYLYQQNMKAVVPMLISTKGYGILMDSYSLMTFHDDAFGSYLWSDINDEMDYYFIYGPEFDDIIREYRELTGKAPMLPKWVFGYVQSKERYKTQEELVEIVKEYRKRQIPLDLVVLDWRSWEGELWGQKTLDPSRFPDPKDMMKQLHDLNARLMVSIWPNMSKGGDNHKEMHEKGYLLGNQSTYDAFSKQARELYWKHANDGLFSNGIDSWWCDCTEPFEADWKGEVKPEPEERVHINTGEAKKYLDPEYINAYSLLHSGGIYEGQRKTTDHKRVVNMTRSSYAGQHRYSTITWSGDISANWETLRKQIPDGLNFCITGEPYWTLDIGGFFVGNEKSWRKSCGNPDAPKVWFWNGDYDDGCQDLGYRELYLRWFQYGAFLPMFRSHGTDTPREVWRFGEPGTVFYDTLVKFTKLRYRLIPYIYSLAGMVTHEDYTIMRALAFDFRQDQKVYDIKEQYMFGPAFMVNPVTKPMHYESNSRKLEDVEETRLVYLPEGTLWYDFWTGSRYEGGQSIIAAAGLETMPLYIRGGSIVPMGPVIQHTGEKPDVPVELRLYPGADGEFTLYEDEGDNYNYEKGAFSCIHMKWKDSAKELVFGERVGSFPGMDEKKTFRVILVSEGSGTGLEEAEQANRIVEYTGKEVTISLE